MKNYIIINPQSKFGYDFIREEDGKEIFRKEITSKTTDGYYHLPEIVNGRKLIQAKKLENVEKFCLDDLPEKMPKSTNVVKSNEKKKINLTEYYTENEKAEIEKLQSKIDKINERAMERAKKDIKMNELRTTLKNLDPETLAKLIEEFRNEKN